jgi:hypothetical protein
VVTKRYAVNATADQLTINLRRDAGPTRDIFGVGNHQVQIVVLAQLRNQLHNNSSPGLADDITDVQNPHDKRLSV